MTYIFTITYNFDSSYVAKQCNTYEEALKMLQEYLSEEVETVKNESEYMPSVLQWTEDDVTLVYEEGYTIDGCRVTAANEYCDGNSYALKDCAYYRIFQLEA